MQYIGKTILKSFDFSFYQIQTISWTVTTKGPEQVTTPERMMTFTMKGKTKHDFSNSISLSKIAFVFLNC